MAKTKTEKITSIEEEIRQSVLAEMTQNVVAENAQIAQNQKEYQK